MSNIKPMVIFDPLGRAEEISKILDAKPWLEMDESGDYYKTPAELLPQIRVIDPENIHWYARRARMSALEIPDWREVLAKRNLSRSEWNYLATVCPDISDKAMNAENYMCGDLQREQVYKPYAEAKRSGVYPDWRQALHDGITREHWFKMCTKSPELHTLSVQRLGTIYQRYRRCPLPPGERERLTALEAAQRQPETPVIPPKPTKPQLLMDGFHTDNDRSHVHWRTPEYQVIRERDDAAGAKCRRFDPSKVGIVLPDESWITADRVGKAKGTTDEDKERRRKRHVEARQAYMEAIEEESLQRSPSLLELRTRNLRKSTIQTTTI